MIFLSPFLDVTRMSVSTVLFPGTGRLWNSVPIECFPLTYDLKCRINRDLFYCRFFLNRFPVCCNLFVLVFLLTPCLVVTVQPCMEWVPIKKNCLILRLYLKVCMTPWCFKSKNWWFWQSSLSYPRTDPGSRNIRGHYIFQE